MDVPRIISSLLLLVCILAEVSSFKNDMGVPSFVRQSRRISLNEYLMPPPPPRQYTMRKGRLTNPKPTEAPGYFSTFINWFNPFSYGTSSSPPPSHREPSFPSPSNLSPQHISHNPQNPAPAGPYYNPPPPLQNILSPPAHNGHLPPTNNHAGYLPPNKEKTCNPCNKVPWVPMQTSGLHSEKLPFVQPPLQLPVPDGDYHPSNNQKVSYDIQHAVSQEVRPPDFSPVHFEQSRQPSLISPLPNPHLYPGAVPPLYKAEPFNKFLEPIREGNGGYHESLPEGTNHHPQPVINQGHSSFQFNNEGYVNQHSVHANQDLTSSGTQANQSYASAIPQNHGAEFNTKGQGYKESFGSSTFDNQSSITEVLTVQDYYDSPVLAHELDTKTYHQSPISNSGYNTAFNHFAPNVDSPLSELPSSSFNIEPDRNDVRHRHYDDLSSSSSVVKDSHVTVQSASSSVPPSSNESPVHYEESPLLDLTKNDEDPTNVPILSAPAKYSDINENSSDVMPTTISYNSNPENDYFKTLFNPIGSNQPPPFNLIQVFNGSVESTTATNIDSFVIGNENPVNQKTVNNDERDVSYPAPSVQPGFLWTSLLDSDNENLTKGSVSVESQGGVKSQNLNSTFQGQQTVKRNKQVQVIIPYTSEYTPIPFQQFHGDWSVKNNVERTQARKVPSSKKLINDKYVGQESRHDVQIINQLEPRGNFSILNNVNSQSTTPLSAVTTAYTRSTPNKVNNSIDVHRLQKNIDNWTIQEYSRATTSSTVLPSSLHPYLLPSKKIPDEYLTTTESDTGANSPDRVNVNVKTYTLAGFTFNDLEQEQSASTQVEEARIQVVPAEILKSTSNSNNNTAASTSKNESSWKSSPVSVSSLNKERVYVVTPQPVFTTTFTDGLGREKKGKNEGSSKYVVKPISTESKKNKKKLTEFEAIERAYQVLPQAVNNLAVASTGKESIPLWGIMEHEEFASLNVNDDEDIDTDVVDGPILYTGHSKVSRGKL